jgi:hypothetical protein
MVMQDVPLVALDLPLKVLIYDDAIVEAITSRLGRCPTQPRANGISVSSMVAFEPTSASLDSSRRVHTQRLLGSSDSPH